MALNTECIVKSLKKDWSEIYRSVAVFVAFCIGSYVGYIFQKEILSIALPTCSLSMVSLIVGIIVLIGCVLDVEYDPVGGKKSAKGNSCLSHITLYLFVMYLAEFMFFILSIVYLAGIKSNDQFTFLNEVVVVWIGLTFATIIITPFIRSYVICRDEPVTLVTSGEENEK
jgi:hypothetical protein